MGLTREIRDISNNIYLSVIKHISYINIQANNMNGFIYLTTSDGHEITVECSNASKTVKIQCPVHRYEKVNFSQREDKPVSVEIDLGINPTSPSMFESRRTKRSQMRIVSGVWEQIQQGMTFDEERIRKIEEGRLRTNIVIQPNCFNIGGDEGVRTMQPQRGVLEHCD